MSERKLPQEQVEEIRKELKAGSKRPPLAAKYNVSNTTIRRIQRNQSYLENVPQRSMKVGFTGNQIGMTDAQKAWLRDAFSKIQGPWEFHHGDCVGSDAEAHDIAVEFGAAIIIHPPSNPAKRAFKTGGPRRIPKPYLDRNKDIVNEAEVLIGMPKEVEEQLRSGTWSTIRFARRTSKPTRVIGPDGVRLNA